MNIFEAIVYGVVQGATEFLPVSSTAHLILVRWFLGWKDPGLAFDVALHFGTLLALIWYFREDWRRFAAAGLRLLGRRRGDADERLALQIVAATIPGGLAGLLAEDLVETYLRSPLVIATALIVLALALVAAERMGRREKHVAEISWRDALAVGAAQALAIVPGVSRSGVTITAGLFCGLQRTAAARFSFLLSTPIIAGAALKQAADLVAAGLDQAQVIVLGTGIAVAGVVGYLAIRFMLRFLATNTTYAFIYYRILLGVVVLLAFWGGFR